MPRYNVTDPASGKSAVLEGDSPPSEAELEDVFKTLGAPTQPKPGLSDYIAASVAAEGEQYNAPPIDIPVVGAPGTLTRGISKGVSGLVRGATTPEGLALGAALMTPVVGEVAGPLMAGAMIAQGAGLAKEAYDTKSLEPLGEALVVGGLGALGARGALKGAMNKLTPETAKAIDAELVAPEPKAIPESRRLTGTGVPMPETQGGSIGPEPRTVAPESRQLLAPRTPLPESTPEPSTILTHGAEPGEVIQRITLPVEPEAATRARQVWSNPVNPESQSEGADALRQLVSMTDETKTPGQPYKPPTVSVDLRQLGAMMQRNTVSKVESWADEVISNKLKGTSANPFLDPEFMAAAATKGAILFKRGITKLDEWNDAMRQQFGKGLDEVLPEIYQKSKDYWESKPPTAGASNASEVQTPTAVHGDVQSQPIQGKGQMPANESGQRVQPKTEGRVSQETPVGSGEDIFGISQDAREQMASTGRFPYTPPGQGTTAWEQIQRGRKLIREGADPAEALNSFETTKRASSADFAVVRAHMEQLYQDARKVESQYGSDSPQYLAKQSEMADWWTRTKPMGTEWHAMGEAQQGMTDIDTGSLVGMEKAHHDATGEMFTPKQTAEASDLSKTVRDTKDESAGAQQKAIESIDKDVADMAPKPKPGESKPKPSPVPKTPEEALRNARKAVAAAGQDKTLTPNAVQAIWQHAKKSYIEQGESNLDAIGQGVADDLGLPKQTVMEVLAGSKSTKAVTDEMYLKMARARQAQAAAKNWLINQRNPGWLNALKKIPSFFFTKATFGHGTVGMVTHAGPLMFDPAKAADYWTNFARQYKLLANEGYHEAMMQDLMHRPNFIAAKRAGLANDPFKFQDDYQNLQLALGLGKWMQMGQRGFDVLKLLRQDIFDRTWDSYDATQRTPEGAKLLANGINHSTGVTTGSLGGKAQGVLSTIFFAPKLEGSRWAFAIGDPAKAAEIMTRWGKASPEERTFAMSEAKQKARIAGTYLSLLAINQGLLSAFGSDQEINFKDPGQGDFLAFKGFGKNINIISPMLRMVGLLAHLIQISTGQRTKFEQLTPRDKAAAEAVWKYGRGKLSPFSATVTDLASQSDYQGRPLPFSEDKVPKSVKRQGFDRYTWPQYLLGTQTPIPVEEAVREVWRSQGMDESQIKTALGALLVFTITGGTGARISPDYSQSQ